MADLSQDFFTAAKSQFDAAAKWQILILAALLYFHFGIVGPFGQSSADMQATRDALVRQLALQKAIAPASERAKAFGSQVTQATHEASQVLLSGLVNRFGKLDRVVAALVGMPEESAAGQEGATLFAEQQGQMQMQQQPLLDPTNIDLPPMDEELRRFVARVGDQVGGDLPSALESYIQAAVIGPAFEAANRDWQGAKLPAIQEAAAGALAAIAAAKAETPDASAELAASEQSVGALRDQAQSFRFTPPEGSNWWRSVAGKGESISAMLATLSNGIQGAAQSQLNLAAIQSQAESTIAKEQAIAAEIAQELDRLEAQAKELQAQLGELGGPLKVIAFKLSELAPLLPLIIAMAIAGGSFWIASTVRKMCLALALPIRSDQDANMKAWLKDIAGGNARRLVLREGLILALLLAWVIAAIYLVRGLEATLLPYGVTAGLSVALVIGARAWVWRQSVEALKMAERPA